MWLCSSLLDQSYRWREGGEPQGQAALPGHVLPLHTMHPDYNKKTMDNDIAVLELAEELTFTDKIKPACLPSSASKDYSGTASTISGWGGTIGYGPRDPRPKQPQQCGLKETMVKVLAGSDSKCSGALGTSSSKIKLCAWSKDTDTCQGDSGGPLTVPENGHIFALFFPKTVPYSVYLTKMICRQVHTGGCGELRMGLRIVYSGHLRSSPRIPALDQEPDLKRRMFWKQFIVRRSNHCKADHCQGDHHSIFQWQL